MGAARLWPHGVLRQEMYFILIFELFFCSTGVCTQGLVLARQARYHLSQLEICFRVKELKFLTG
jgi:hypothetical protein